MDEVNNATRAQWAMDVISQDAARHGTENDQQSLSDLLNNIMHLAAARKNVYFVAALILAKMNPDAACTRNEIVKWASTALGAREWESDAN